MVLMTFSKRDYYHYLKNVGILWDVFTENRRAENLIKTKLVAGIGDFLFCDFLFSCPHPRLRSLVTSQQYGYVSNFTEYSCPINQNKKNK